MSKLTDLWIKVIKGEEIEEYPKEVNDLYDYTIQLQQERDKYKSIVEEIKEENKALLTLVKWCEECGISFDNFATDDVNWEEFEEESKDMGYIESMVYYAKKYNKIKELEEGENNGK